jgi:type II secretory pathway predicted ATPase ExeA
MHRAHWGLQASPFRPGPDLGSFFESPTHEEALSRLTFLVENGRRLGLLLGARGSGKSLLLGVLARKFLRQGAAVVQVNLLGLETRELLWALATQLGVCPADDAPSFVLWRALSDRLAELRHERVTIVLLLDDADQGPPETLDSLLRLLSADPWVEARLTVILTADPARTARLGARLLELAELRIELEPWDETDTAAYLADCLARAGGQTNVFDPQAAARLHELSGGVPRKINQLAELALLAGAAGELDQVDEPTIDAVYQELSFLPSERQEFAWAAE